MGLNQRIWETHEKFMGFSGFYFGLGGRRGEEYGERRKLRKFTRAARRDRVRRKDV